MSGLRGFDSPFVREEMDATNPPQAGAPRESGETVPVISAEFTMNLSLDCSSNPLHCGVGLRNAAASPGSST